MEASLPEGRLERGEAEVLEITDAQDGLDEAPEEPSIPRPSATSIVPLPEREGSGIERSRTAMAIFAQRPRWARSDWRFPTNRGQVPRYMQRAFRWKTFGLMTLQLAMVLLIAVPLRQLEILERFVYPEDMETFLRQGIVYFFGVLNLVSILLLHCYKDRFPANYMFLAVTTLTSGVFWSLAYSKTFMTMMQFEILGILFVTMFSATVISTILSGMERKIQPTTVLIFSFLPGWCMGCCAILLQRLIMDLPLPLELLGAIGVSAILLGVMFLDVGPLLVRCDPDDFMRVIVSMNSTMMVVVSIPFFFLAFCTLRLDTREDDPTAVTAMPQTQPSELRPQVVQAAQRVGVAY